jgi:hypothetical protein
MGMGLSERFLKMKALPFLCCHCFDHNLLQRSF